MAVEAGKMGNKAKKANPTGAHGFLPLDGNVASTPVKRKRGKREQIVSRDGEKPTVLYIGRIPHGFYEEQIRGFFQQFGAIKRLRISRNKKTGNSKHYGFIEFESPEVAEIVADCMHNYLLFEHMLQVHLIPHEKIHPNLWVGANQKFKLQNWRMKGRKRHNRERTVEEQHRLMKAILKKDAKRRKKIQAAGIDYEFPDITEGLPLASKKIRFSDDEE